MGEESLGSEESHGEEGHRVRTDQLVEIVYSSSSSSCSSCSCSCCCYYYYYYYHYYYYYYCYYYYYYMRFFSIFFLHLKIINEFSYMPFCCRQQSSNGLFNLFKCLQSKLMISTGQNMRLHVCAAKVRLPEAKQKHTCQNVGS